MFQSKNRLPRFRHKTSTVENARLKGSALALRAAFANINIHKSRSVYYVSQKDSGRAVVEKMQTWHIWIYE
jgi:hypothetical protein